MGLDATVFCDCYEKGKLRAQPPPGTVLRVEADGSLSTTGKQEALEAALAFDEWQAGFACEHPNGVLLHHRLGNISLIGLLRSELRREPLRFPILLGKVVYSGTHGGDYISAELAPELQKEIEALADFKCSTKETDDFMSRFRTQMLDLVVASRSVNKPIAF